MFELHRLIKDKSKFCISVQCHSELETFSGSGLYLNTKEERIEENAINCWAKKEEIVKGLMNIRTEIDYLIKELEQP